MSCKRGTFSCTSLLPEVDMATLFVGVGSLYCCEERMDRTNGRVGRRRKKERKTSEGRRKGEMREKLRKREGRRRNSSISTQTNFMKN